MNWRPPLRGCHAPTRPRHSGWPDASFPAWPPWTPRPGSAVTEGATADLEDNVPSRDCPGACPDTVTARRDAPAAPNGCGGDAVRRRRAEARRSLGRGSRTDHGAAAGERRVAPRRYRSGVDPRRLARPGPWRPGVPREPDDLVARRRRPGPTPPGSAP